MGNCISKDFNPIYISNGYIHIINKFLLHLFLVVIILAKIRQKSYNDLFANLTLCFSIIHFPTGIYKK